MATRYQVQRKMILEDGTIVLINPINDALDTTVGSLSNGDVTKLPGANKNEMLQETLRTIRAHLYNIKDISKKLRTISSTVTDSTDATIPNSSVTAGLHTRLLAAEGTLEDHQDEIDGKAPIMHASNALTYGGGTGEKYGHVKLSDLWASQANTTGASSSVGASQLAVYNAYNDLNTKKAPNNHAIAGDTYGKATSALYGHVATYNVANTTTDPTDSADMAQVATRRALYNIWKRLADKDTAQDGTIAGKAAINHASTANSYGVGTTGSYGHLKISNTYDETSPTDAGSGAAAAMAASSYAVRAAYNSVKSLLSGKAPTSHAVNASTYGLGTGSVYGHVKLSDTYTSGVTASNGIAPSTKALYDVYSLVASLRNTVSTLNSNLGKVYKTWSSSSNYITISTKYISYNDYVYLPYKEFLVAAGISLQASNKRNIAKTPIIHHMNIHGLRVSVASSGIYPTKVILDYNYIFTNQNGVFVRTVDDVIYPGIYDADAFDNTLYTLGFTAEGSGNVSIAARYSIGYTVA